MEFLGLLRKITKSKIRHLIVGGIAVNLHGIIRPTKDIDPDKEGHRCLCEAPVAFRSHVPEARFDPGHRF